MWTNFPLFGSALVVLVLLSASYTFAVSVLAGATGRVRTLQAARLGAYGTVALVAVTVLCLAYAFVSHDFRLRYVAHYSERAMSPIYLFTALWGGQDGSILWWLFLMSLYIGACVRWLGNKYLELQPYVIATLMCVVLFFCVLMMFPANPFATSVAGARADGEGLNPLLRNFYMIIHPPSLYVGFVGCAIPFAFGVAALITGRLDTEWIRAARKWMLFPWMFLGIGNTLGMLWAYEELGWGGYWGWDPVENAAFMPFLVASAYLHSVMIQERRGLLKVWNIFLVCLTFFMTIFGTFLTRSGAIASVHSFAQSSIGTYFVWFLVIVALFCFLLVLYRWPELRDLPKENRIRYAAMISGSIIVGVVGPGMVFLLGRNAAFAGIGFSWKVLIFAAAVGVAVFVALELVMRRMTAHLITDRTRPYIESILSREFTFLLNNYALLGFMGFVLIATTFPMISEALWNEKVTVGPPYYNAWVQPIGLVIYILMGVGTLFGWKKTSDAALRRAFIAPLVATAVAVALHFAFGKMLGFPAVVWGDAIYNGTLGAVLRGFNAGTPVLGVAVSVFNIAVIVQEFVFLFRAQASSREKQNDLAKARGENPKEGLPGWARVLGLVLLGPIWVLYELAQLPPNSRRRYGGYVVHFGLVVMLLGFTGQSWNINKETALSPGQTYQLDAYTIQYLGPRMEVDAEKRMIFADVAVEKNGKSIGKVAPAKFIYKKMPESPTTEVQMLHTFRDDLYMIVGNINPQTKLATFQMHVNPLVSWIWVGCLILILGSVVCMWPEFEPEESRVFYFARGAVAAAGATAVGIFIALMPTQAFALQTSSLHAGTVHIENDKEREIFSGMRCMCGGCARDPLSTCACGDAETQRERIRKKIEAGETKDQILSAYAAEFGTAALSVPPNTGGMQAIYLFPLGGIGAAGIGLALMLKRWRRAPGNKATGQGSGDGPSGTGAAPSEGDAKKKSKGKSDAYDARLDAELNDLDR
jgi:cytochrome c-type biogenesis protein CcmF